MARRDDDPRHRQLRQRVAREAAQLLAETGSDDLSWARRKAAARLGARDDAALPGSDEILAALREHRQLFGGDPAAAERGGRRQRHEAALEAMHYFADLEPRLVDPDRVDTGPDAPLRLHLHADDPDAVARRLLERGVPARQRVRTVRLDRERGVDVPAWTFDAGGVPFELLQLPLSALRQAPRDPLDDRPLERASIAALRRRLADEDAG